jgi:hypothetical protein
MILTEMVHDVRVIRIGERDPLPEPISARGWAIRCGRWEGDTLVIETTNLREEQINAYGYLFPGGSEDMRVIERLTIRADASTLNYEFTVIDPATYTAREWGGQVPFKRLPGLVYEYACHEGNYAMSNVLSGARATRGATAAPTGEYGRCSPPRRRSTTGSTTSWRWA